MGGSVGQLPQRSDAVSGKRGVFRAVVDLHSAIKRYIAETNQMPKPFVWTADPDKIIAAVRRGHQALDLIR